MSMYNRNLFMPLKKFLAKVLVLNQDYPIHGVSYLFKYKGVCRNLCVGRAYVNFIFSSDGRWFCRVIEVILPA